MNLPQPVLLGRQLKDQRHAAGLSQAEVGSRVGRSPARISELERDLLRGRWGRDRLTLLLEICDALGLEPVLIPRNEAEKLANKMGWAGSETSRGQQSSTSAFDDLFIDLGDEDGPR